MSSTNKIQLMALIVLAYSTLNLSAQSLTWPEVRLKGTVYGDNEIFRASFKFSNDSHKKVKLLELQPTCGCTLATLQKMEYLPGERGEIFFKVRVSKVVSTLSKSIKVYIEHKTKPVVLSFKITREKVFKEDGLTRKGVKLQVSCPYLRTPIKKEFYHDVQGMRIYTCCQPCLTKVRNKPQEALRLLTQMGQYPEFSDEGSPRRIKVVMSMVYSGGIPFTLGLALMWLIKNHQTKNHKNKES